jgi:pyruvate-formate lyase-activating enzyme
MGKTEHSSQITELGETLSLCPYCFRVITANIFEENNKIFMLKEHCGKSLKVIQENDPDFYKRTSSLKTEGLCKGYKIGKTILESRKEAVKYFPQIYLQITNRCNLSCPICYELDRHGGSSLSIKTIKRIIKKSPADYYVLSGGDPTMHRKLFDIVRILKKEKKYVCLLTNGIKLADAKYTRKLKSAGIDEVAMSFDGLDDEIYTRIRGRPLLQEKLRAMENMRENNIKFGLYCVVDKEVNFNQIKETIDFAIKNKDHISKVWFGCLNKKEKTSTTRSDIWKQIGKNYGIPLDYVVEEWKLRYLVNKFAEKLFGENGLRRFSAINHNSIYTLVHGGNMKTLFELNNLREINSVLEKALKKGKTRLILTILLNFKKFARKGTFKLLKAMVLSGFSVENASGKINNDSIIRLRVGGVAEPYVIDMTQSCALMAYGIEMNPILTGTDLIRVAGIDTPY